MGMMHQKRWFFLILISFLIVPIVIAQQTNQNVRIVGDDDNDALQTIIEFMAWSGINNTVDVTIGQIPEGTPIAILVPDDVSLVGGITRQYQAGESRIIWFTSDLTPETLNTAIESLYLNADWSFVEGTDASGGFGTSLSNYTGLCSPDDTTLIGLRMMPMNERTGIILEISDASVIGVCGNQSSQAQALPDAITILPSLTEPDGVQELTAQIGGNSSISTDYVMSSSSIVLQSDNVSLTDILDSYTGQINEQGWQLITADTTETIASAIWLMTDETGTQWSLILTISPLPNRPNHYHAYLRAEGRI